MLFIFRKAVHYAILLTLIGACILFYPLKRAISRVCNISTVEQAKDVLKKSLVDVLDKYAQTHDAVIIAELPVITTDNLVVKQRVFDKEPEDVEDLRKLLQAFDYDVDDRNEVIILRRRYDIPGSVPDISVEECIQFLDDVLRLIEPFKTAEPTRSNPGTNPLVTNLYGLLSPQQKEITQHSPVAVRDLPAAQQEALRQSCLFIYTAETMASWKQVRAILGATSTGYFVNRAMPRKGKTNSVLGYVAMPSANRELFIPIENEELKANSGTLPKRLEQIKGFTSLGDIVHRIALARNESISVGTGLETKQLLVLGSVEKMPQKDIEAIGDLFGLTLEPQQPSGRILRRPEAKAVTRITDLSVAITKTCPPSLLRAVGAKPIMSPVSPLRVLDVRTRIQIQLNNYKDAVTASSLRISQLQKVVYSGLKFSFDKFQPTVNAGAAVPTASPNIPSLNRALPFNRLTTEEQKVFAQYLLLPAMVSVRDRFTGNAPDYVRKFDDLYFVGKESNIKNQKWFKIVLMTKDDYGTFINAMTIDGRVE